MTKITYLQPLYPVTKICVAIFYPWAVYKENAVKTRALIIFIIYFYYKQKYFKNESKFALVKCKVFYTYINFSVVTV